MLFGCDSTPSRNGFGRFAGRANEVSLAWAAARVWECVAPNEKDFKKNGGMGWREAGKSFSW